MRGAMNHIRGFLIGRDPRCIGTIWQEIYRSQHFGGKRVLDRGTIQRLITPCTTWWPAQ